MEKNQKQEKTDSPIKQGLDKLFPVISGINTTMDRLEKKLKILKLSKDSSTEDNESNSLTEPVSLPKISINPNEGKSELNDYMHKLLINIEKINRRIVKNTNECINAYTGE